MGRRGSLLVIVAVSIAALTACAVCAAKPSTKVVFERSYRAVSVVPASGTDPFEDDHRIQISFGPEPELTTSYTHSLGWAVRCNLHGAAVKIGTHRLWIKPNFQTEQGCGGDWMLEEEWMSAFLDADPRWEVGRRGRLVLSGPLGTVTLAPSVTTM
jgi:hypothetical protein